MGGDRVTRRRLLATCTATATAAVGGCLGGGDRTPTDTGTPTTAEGTTAAAETAATETTATGTTAGPAKVTVEGNDEDLFGHAVATDGDTALVGAPGAENDDENRLSASGLAHVLERGATGWAPAVTLTPDADDGGDNDRFGDAVALADGRALVGAPGEDSAGIDSGAAYVFARGGEGWTRQARLVADDLKNGETFGGAVALAEDTALVSARRATPNGLDSGAAYVFERRGGGWAQATKLVPDDGDDNDGFGYSVALSPAGDVAVVGAYWDERPESGRTGSAYVFERGADGWAQAAKLVPEDGADGDVFGEAVATDGDVAAVGAAGNGEPGAAGVGAVYLYDRASGWAQAAKLLPATVRGGTRLGSSLALSGDTLLAGAAWDDDPNGDRAGAAYVFARGDGGWTQRRKLAAPDGDERDMFGTAVGLAGGTAVAGAPGDEDPNGRNGGAAYLFDV